MRIVLLEGDETGQELLDEAVRVLQPGLLGVPITVDRIDLRLETRRGTQNRVGMAVASWPRRRTGRPTPRVESQIDAGCGRIRDVAMVHSRDGRKCS